MKRIFLLLLFFVSIYSAISAADPGQLHQAIKNQDVQLVKALLQQNPEYAHTFEPFQDGTVYKEQRSYNTNPILYEIITFSETLHKSLNSNELIRGPSTLTLAVQTGSIEIAQELLQMGVNADSQHLVVYENIEDPAHNRWVISAKAISPLSVAIELKDLNMIKLLLEHHAQPQSVQQYLKAQLKHVYFGSMRLGRSRRNEFSIAQMSKQSAIRLALDHDEILRTLISYQIGKKIKPEQVPQQILEFYKTYENDQIPILHHTMLFNDVNAFKSLLVFNPNLEMTYLNKTVWECALEHENPEFLIILRKNQVPEQPMKKLLYAVQSGRLDRVQQLLKILDHGKLASDEAGVKELFRAGFTTKKVELVDFLFQSGFNHPDLFALAVEMGNVEMVKLVLRYPQT